MTGVIQPSLPARKGPEVIGTVPATANCPESTTAIRVIRFTIEMVIVVVVVVAVAGETGPVMIEAPVMGSDVVVGVASKGTAGVRCAVVLRLLAEAFSSEPLQLRSLVRVMRNRNPTNLPERE